MKHYLRKTHLQAMLCYASISLLCIVLAVSSPAYTSHAGPTSLQHRLSLDVGMGGVEWLCCGQWLHPNLRPPILPQSLLGENTD